MSPRALTSMLCAAAIGVAGAIGAIGCGGTSAALDPVAQAADATMHAGGAQVAMSGEVSSPQLGEPVSLTGHGAFNFDAREGNFSMSMTLPAAAQQQLHVGTLEITELFKASTLYLGSSLLDGRLPGGARWVKLDLASVGQAIGLNPSALTSGGANPAEYLRDLRASGGHVVRVGSEAIRGVQTNHYAASIDLLKTADTPGTPDPAQARTAIQQLIAQGMARTIPVQVWVDADHLLRRMSLSVDVAAAGKQAQTSLAMEFFDFGTTPTVTPPPGSEVFDATRQALQGLAGAGI